MINNNHMQMQNIIGMFQNGNHGNCSRNVPHHCSHGDHLMERHKI